MVKLVLFANGSAEVIRGNGLPIICDVDFNAHVWCLNRYSAANIQIIIAN